jgi:hypothetical protein
MQLRFGRRLARSRVRVPVLRIVVDHLDYLGNNGSSPAGMRPKHAEVPQERVVGRGNQCYQTGHELHRLHDALGLVAMSCGFHSVDYAAIAPT